MPPEEGGKIIFIAIRKRTIPPDSQRLRLEIEPLEQMTPQKEKYQLDQQCQQQFTDQNFSPTIFIRNFIQKRKEHRDIPQWIHDQDQGQGRRKQVYAVQPSVSSCQTRRDWSSFNDEH